MTDLHELTALETAAAVARGEVSAVEVVDHALGRAATLGAALGAFTVLDGERARARAASIDAGGAGVGGPLRGVPTAVKDLTATAGVVTARGSVLHAGHVPDHDDDVVGLLAAAGTVSIGKTAVPEFGLPCYTEPAGAPPAVTPWDRGRSAGGSSGGAAAAVAARIVPVAHGTDGGGSIRIPASVTGLVGLKTTRGRVPAGPAGGDPAGLSVHGPLARTVADAAAYLDALCGARSWPAEPFVPAAPPPGGYLAALRPDGPRRRIGLCTTSPLPDLAAVVGDDVAARALAGLERGDFLTSSASDDAPRAPVDRRCAAAAEGTAAVLEGLGHEVEPVEVGLSDEVVEAFLVLWGVLSLADPVEPRDEPRLQPLTRHLRARGREVTGVGGVAALHAVQVATRRTIAGRAHLDAVLTPSVAMLPRPVGWFSGGGAQRSPTGDAADGDPAVDFARQIAFTPWTAIANLTGEPALGLPTGWPEVGGTTLPVGVTLRGRRGEEEVLLGLGAEVEAAVPWAHRTPPGD